MSALNVDISQFSVLAVSGSPYDVLERFPKSLVRYNQSFGYLILRRQIS